MNSSLPNAVRRLSGERPPGEMPSIDPDSMESDATFAAIISRDDTGKLTVAHRADRPAASPSTASGGPDAGDADKPKNGGH